MKDPVLLTPRKLGASLGAGPGTGDEAGGEPLDGTTGRLDQRDVVSSPRLAAMCLAVSR